MSNQLEEEIKKARLQIHTDGYPMSIGELVNLYEDGELEIHPEFQRVYRWTDSQKSKLIESILLDIPLPSIFVSQRSDGAWDVIDGLQRLSTILSFMGKLENEKGQKNFLMLQSTQYLPSLEGKKWESPDNLENEISVEVKRLFKRTKIDIKIIKRESHEDAQYELFQRLNTGGSKLSDQEVRSCILLMANPKAFEFIKNLSQDDNFTNTTPLSGKKEDEAYREELVLRYFIQRHLEDNNDNKEKDMAPFITTEMIRIFAPNSNFNYKEEEKIFKETFRLLNETLADETFRKFNQDKGRAVGSISIPIFEVFALAVSQTVEKQTPISEEKIKEAHKNLPQDQEFNTTITYGTRPVERIKTTRKIGLRLLK